MILLPVFGTNSAANWAKMALSGSVNVLPLKGEIDLHVSPRIARSLAGVTAKRPAHIVVDLTDVTFVDSSGLAVLIHGMQDVQEYGGKFAIVGLQENVRPIFEISRLDQFFQIFPNIDDALAGK
jgi:anti-sigma B factor antagonist